METLDGRPVLGLAAGDEGVEALVFLGASVSGLMICRKAVWAPLHR